MKKVISVIVAAALIFSLAGCSLFKEKEDISGKYTYSSTVSIKSADGSSTDKILASYTITVKGSAEDVANIKKHKVVLSEEAEKLLVEQGQETQEVNDDGLVINGTMTFDTSAMSTDEINSTKFISGLEITDGDGNSCTLTE